MLKQLLSFFTGKPEASCVPVRTEPRLTATVNMVPAVTPMKSIKSRAQIIIPNEWRALQADLEDVSSNYFISGRAGTGKSTLLRYIRKHSSKRVAMLAPTGLAALNVCGQTIHSFCHFRPHIIPAAVRQSELYRQLDLILIDEISMVRCDLLDGLDIFLRLNGRDRNKPFGGVQVIICGDIFQLEPVVEPADIPLLQHQGYQSFFFWGAKCYATANFQALELDTCFRQHDSEFIELLGRIRINIPLDTDFDILNSRLSVRQDNLLTLCPTNNGADVINQAELNKILDAPVHYYAQLSGVYKKIPQHKLADIMPCDLELVLKPGARVIFVKNDLHRRWVNGSLGIVTATARDNVIVKLESGIEHVVYRDKWESYRHAYNKITGTITHEKTGAINQLPLRLAWGLTIHKAQGMTLSNVHVDLCNGTFAHGQAYVALSRCPSIEGLSLSRKVWPNDIIVKSEAIEFYNTVRMS